MGLFHHEKDQQQQQMQQQPMQQQQYGQPQQYGGQPQQYGQPPQYDQSQQYGQPQGQPQFGGQQVQQGPYVYPSAQTAQPPQTMNQEQKEHHHLSGIGKSLGNAVMWGAGATLGADAVNGAINAFKGN